MLQYGVVFSNNATRLIDSCINNPNNIKKIKFQKLIPELLFTENPCYKS
jgi:hypothetical protein